MLDEIFLKLTFL